LCAPCASSRAMKCCEFAIESWIFLKDKAGGGSIFEP
jgi:hypothetical protein